MGLLLLLLLKKQGLGTRVVALLGALLCRGRPSLASPTHHRRRRRRGGRGARLLTLLVLAPLRLDASLEGRPARHVEPHTSPSPRNPGSRACDHRDRHRRGPSALVPSPLSPSTQRRSRFGLASPTVPAPTFPFGKVISKSTGFCFTVNVTLGGERVPPVKAGPRRGRQGGRELKLRAGRACGESGRDWEGIHQQRWRL